MKSIKSESDVLIACVSSLDPGRRFFPLLFVMDRGFPLESGKSPSQLIAHELRKLTLMHAFLKILKPN